MNQTFPVLGELSEAEQQLFLQSLVMTEHKPGEILFREGDPGDYLLLLLEGEARLSRLTPGAEELRLADVGPGDVIGEMAVLSPAPRSATATCLSKTRVAWLSRDNLLERLVTGNKAAGVVLQVCTLLVCDRLERVRERAVVLRGALTGASPSEVDARIAQLVGQEQGRTSDLLRNWLVNR